jgi:hypothetical protein
MELDESKPYQIPLNLSIHGGTFRAFHLGLGDWG